MAQGFTRRQQGDLVYLTADLFFATGLVKHAFSTRHGGVSTGALASLNLGFKNDEQHLVQENRRRYLTALGLDPELLVTGQQVHGTEVAQVGREDAGRGAAAWEDGFSGTDALVTNVPGLPLAVHTADCVPILFLDLVRRAIGAAHAGWRGSVAGIALAVLAKLESAYGSRPQDVLVAIGPSIGPCCYEVDEKVVAPLRERFPFWQEITRPHGPGHWLLDLWELNRRALLAAGVPAASIAVAGLCTACNAHDFYSYRAEHGRTGSLQAVIALAP